MGIRGPVRKTREERLAARDEIERLHNMGFSTYKIAERLGISPQQAQYDLAKVREAWEKRFAGRRDEIKQQELAKLDTLEQTYWMGWLRSLDEHTFKLITRTDDGVRVTEKTVSLQDGNPVFLAGIERCIQQRRELLGLDAPKKQALTDDEGNTIPLLALRQLFLQAIQGQVIEGEVVKELPAQVESDDDNFASE